MADENNSPEPLDKIGETIQNKFKEYFKPSQDYKLVFTFDGKEYSTIFTFRNTGLTNGCITISYDDDDNIDIVSSMISSNSTYKKCFNPVLTSEGGLPSDVTQTDILQVLNTKLKFILRYPTDEITLVDAAKLPDPDKPGFGEFSVPFSYWRVVRGERPIYQKYGYYFHPFSVISDFAKTKKWNEVKDVVIDSKTRKTINDLWLELYPCEKISEKDTIAIVMKKTGDKQTEKESRIVKAIFNLIKRRFTSNNNDNEFNFDIAKFVLSRTSGLWSKWESWDKRLQIKSFEPVDASATTNAGAGAAANAGATDTGVGAGAAANAGATGTGAGAGATGANAGPSANAGAGAGAANTSTSGGSRARKSHRKHKCKKKNTRKIK